MEEGRPRKHCSACSWTFYPRVAASADGVLIRDGRVLLVRRKRTPFRGTWMLPAGFVDFGEHPEETLAREFHEETGLTVSQARFIGLHQSADDPREPGHFLFFYEVEATGEELRTDPEENDGIAWFDLHNLPEIGWERHRAVLALM